MLMVQVKHGTMALPSACKRQWQVTNYRVRDTNDDFIFITNVTWSQYLNFSVFCFVFDPFQIHLIRIPLLWGECMMTRAILTFHMFHLFILAKFGRDTSVVYSSARSHHGSIFDGTRLMIVGRLSQFDTSNKESVKTAKSYT